MDGATDKHGDLAGLMAEMGHEARAAARLLAKTSTLVKNTALMAAAELIGNNGVAIKAANTKDMEAAREKNLSSALLDRLELTDSRIAAMAKGLVEIAALADPVGQVMNEWNRPNGLEI